MRYLALAAILVAGCSTGEECQERTGLYSLRFAELDGNCGQLLERTVRAGEVPSLDPAMTCEDPGAKDSCGGEIDMSCLAPSGASISMRGHVEWEPSGEIGTGEAQIEFRAGNGNCSSRYRLTYRKL